MPKIIPFNGLTQQDIAREWNCSIRSVQRCIRRFKAVPETYLGLQPVFSLSAVATMKRQRHEALLVQHRFVQPARILTVKQAKKLAGRAAR